MGWYEVNLVPLNFLTIFMSVVLGGKLNLHAHLEPIRLNTVRRGMENQHSTFIPDLMSARPSGKVSFHLHPEAIWLNLKVQGKAHLLSSLSPGSSEELSCHLWPAETKLWFNLPFPTSLLTTLPNKELILYPYLKVMINCELGSHFHQEGVSRATAVHLLYPSAKM